MSGMSRREVLGAIGVAAGAGLVRGETPCRAERPQEASVDWTYVPLDPAAIAAEAYRLKPDGGCMYGLFTAVLTVWSKKSGGSCQHFPFHMFQYGEGGIAGWGTVCGALNAGAAVIGLFEKDAARRRHLIGELFSWYESAELPAYRPSGNDSQKMATSTAASVLCHVSLAKWCKASGVEVLAPLRKERCRRLTADVAAKTVELLNQAREIPTATLAATPDAAAPKAPPIAFGKMNCSACHQESEGEPATSSR